MSRDPTSWLGHLEEPKPRNARSWDGSAGDPGITPVGEIRNAATRKDAASALAGGMNVPVRSDLPWGPAARERETREASPEAGEPAASRTAARRARAQKAANTRKVNALKAARAAEEDPKMAATTDKRDLHDPRDRAPYETARSAGFFPTADPKPSDINTVIDRRNIERAEAAKGQEIARALAELAEAAIDLDKALDRHTKAKAAVMAAAGK